jgi:hypothetical protein
MAFDLLPHHADIYYQVFFKDPLYKQLIYSSNKINFVRKVTENFGIRLNDVRFDDKQPSNNFIHFSRFVGQCFLDISFGVEEAGIKIGSPVNKKQVKDSYFLFARLIDGVILKAQKITIQRHLVAKDKVENYLSGYSANLPGLFKDILKGQGFIYNLFFAEQQLNIQLLFANSFIVENGLYLSVDFSFVKEFKAEDVFDIVNDKYESILNEFNLNIVEEKNAGN